MPLWRLQCAFSADTLLPRDQLIITPHFNDAGALSDPRQLCQDMAEGLDAWDGATRQITVKAYDAEGTPPVFPAGEHEVNTSLAPAATGIRQAAVCLSFFAGQNRPRLRGRLYVPGGVAGLTTTQARPTSAHRQKVADLVPLFAGLGGLDVDWVVYSRRDATARKVTDWWVDDVWDIQRSRGLTETARLTGTTGG